MKLPQLEEFRQSTLRAMEVCPRRTMHALSVDPDTTTGWVGQTDDLGTMTHEVCWEIMRTLRRQGEPSMSTEEAMVICREVYAASPIVLSAEEHDDLGWMVRGFASYRWRPERILAIEEPLRLEIVCPDGEIRTLKGTPDLVIADPPRGLYCTDIKSGRSKPKAPRETPPEGEPIEGAQYLSDHGLFQRRVYGCLLLHRYPVAEYVWLQELPLRYPGEPPRIAKLHRSDLEHVLPWIGAHMMKLDNALREGPKSKLWKARPGSQCNKCEVGISCPIPPEMRGDGAIDTDERADEVAGVYVVAKAQYTQAAAQLKARQESGCRPGRANDREEVRWGPEPNAWESKGGGRKFGLWPRVEVATASREGSDE
jgi:PD-(D/E)XK nuclease superfamily protein